MLISLWGDIMTMYERIKYLREKLEMTQQDLADKTGYKTASAVNKIELGLRDLNQRKIIAFAEALHVTPAYLLNGSDDQPKNAIPASGLVPIVGTIPAGYPVLAETDIIGYQIAPVKNTDEYFYLRVSGDSMINKGIVDGCLVLIHKQETADNGQIVACRVNGDDSTLKIFQQQGDTVFLLPANPAYNPIIVPCSQFERGEAAIYGVVKYILTEAL